MQIPAGLLALGAGTSMFGGGQQGGFAGGLQSAANALQQGTNLRLDQERQQFEQAMQIAQFEQQVRAAERAKAAQIAQAQDQAARRQQYVQSLPQDLQALGQFAPDVLAKQQAETAFAAPLTEDQRIDNALAERKFAFEQEQYKTQADLEKRQRALDKGKFDPAAGRFYVTEVGKIDKDYSSAEQRYNSATTSLKAGNATGDKAALVHLARLISDEALQESDIARNVSDGVMPSYFETAWNSIAGKGELSPQARADIQGQLQREITSRYQGYSQAYDRIAQTIPSEITNEEAFRVMQKKRELPKQTRENARKAAALDPNSLTIDQVSSLTDDELDALPQDVWDNIMRQLQATQP